MIWGYQCNRITTLQKKAIRLIYVTKYNLHTEPLFKSLSVLKVEDLLKIQILRFYYKFMHKQLPVYLQNWPIIQNTYTHNHLTRNTKYTHLEHNTNLKKNNYEDNYQFLITDIDGVAMTLVVRLSFLPSYYISYVEYTSISILYVFLKDLKTMCCITWYANYIT